MNDFTVRERALIYLSDKEYRKATLTGMACALGTSKGSLWEVMQELVREGHCGKWKRSDRKGHSLVYMLNKSGIILANTPRWRMKNLGIQRIEDLTRAKRGGWQ
jgi:hypothetical protein